MAARGVWHASEVRILVVEDEASLRDGIVDLLTGDHHAVTAVGDGVAGVEAGLRDPFDLVVLDLMLPRLDGMEVCRRLRAARPGLPILMLTARGSEDDKVRGLMEGADDYVTKPFSIEDVTTRLVSVFRRAALSRSSRVVDDLVLDLQTAQAWRGGEPLILRGVELELLRMLVEEARMPHSAASLAARLHRYGFPLSLAQVVRHLESLARAVDEDRDPMLSHTATGWTLGRL